MIAHHPLRVTSSPGTPPVASADSDLDRARVRDGRLIAAHSTGATLTDEALVAMIARGDRDSLGAFYDRYHTLAYSLAHRILRDASHAEDAVQEGFVALWRAADRFDPRRGRPVAWLLQLVRNKAIDIVRRNTRGAIPTDDSMLTEIPHASALVEDQALDAIHRRSVRQAVGMLSADHRSILELAYFGGQSQSEIALTLGIPLGTVKSRTFAALRTLRAHLEELGYAE